MTITGQDGLPSTFSPAEWQSVIAGTLHLDPDHRCATSVFCLRCARREDLRALALEHEERCSLGIAADTEADLPPV